MTTSSRLLALLGLLQRRRDWPGEVLAQRLGVSSRTVRRDIDRLRALGYRIESTMGPDGGYRLDAGAALPPLLFDDQQGVALAVALQLATTAGAGIEDGALRALATLRQVMPSRLRHQIDAVPLSAVRPPESGPDVDAGVLTSVGAAVRAREVLRFDYSPGGPAAEGGADRAAPPRRVEPHHLTTWRGRWYLVGWDLDHAGWRTYRVDRMHPRVPTGPRVAPRELPGGDVATFLIGRFRGAEGTTQWPCRGAVVVHLPAAEVRPYVGDGVVEVLDGGRTRVSTGSWSWTGLAASLLRFDADLEVLSPPELVDAFARIAARSASAAATARAPDEGPRR
ncbi:helix-turn-helix transcriptional regulator [Georgenia faecalis]|uniref:Helix-turn-helix transcriptional regulator n=1 Tax=Georgenia faecalis TaxID=2483799 RepID=A0ABV9D9B0_9MICO|nr:WYL domain-containing protein [Georgenia faecalis]